MRCTAGRATARRSDPSSAQWIVAYVTDRKTDVRPSGESSTEQLTPQLLEHLRGRALVQDGRGPDDPDVLACTHRHASFFVQLDPEVESLSDGNLRP